MHSKEASEFPCHRCHRGSNHQNVAACLHTAFTHTCPLLSSASCWWRRPWYRSLVDPPSRVRQFSIPCITAFFLEKERSWPFMSEDRDLPTLGKPTSGQHYHISISKCSHLWEGPIASPSQQVWQIRGTVDKGLFYTRRNETASLAPAPQHVHSLYLLFSNKMPPVLFPLLPLLLGRAPNNHLQSDFIVCLQTSLQSLPNPHANKQLVIT